MLGGTGLLDVAHAAVHLHAGRRDLDRVLGTPALHHRRHQVDESLALRPHAGVRMIMRLVGGRADDIGQRAHRLGLALHRHQQPAHVGVPDDRDLRAAAHTGLGALDAVPGVLQRVLVGALGERQAFHADGEAGLVHHDEHVLEATVGLTHQGADRTAVVAEGEHRGGAAVDAELVFDRHAMDVVARPRRAVGVHQELRHHEQRDALHPFGRIARSEPAFGSVRFIVPVHSPEIIFGR
jgi:hypothetical protein